MKIEKIIEFHDEDNEMLKYVYQDTTGKEHVLGVGNVWDSDVKTESILKEFCKLLKIKFTSKKFTWKDDV